MDPSLEYLLWAVVGGIFFWKFVTPMVSRIPQDLESAWRSEYEEYVKYDIEAERVSRKPLSNQFKWGFCLNSVFISFFLLQDRGVGASTFAMMLYLQGVLLLAAINLYSSLLPDKLVLPLLWGGLLFNAQSGNSVDQIYGAALGFGVPWMLYWVFKVCTGKSVLGYGDMKTFAMTGAWFGVDAMPTIFLAFLGVSAIQSVIIKLKLLDGLRRGYIPSGTAHLVASFLWVTGYRFT
jgi:leader peptidase (prepilin peptidase) / N-methyltransferase